MKCERCGQFSATTHVQKTIGGSTQEYHLCTECAKMLGYSNFSFDIGNLWPMLFGGAIKQAVPADDDQRCEKCGASYADFLRNQRVGCAECYTVFKTKLSPSLERIHGKTKHNGKVPRGASGSAKAYSRLEQLKQSLAQAVKVQNYEQAAKLRDEIKSLEEQVNSNG